MKKIALINQKGGVGKTALTINVGYGLATLGHKVLLVDADPQGNMSKVYCSNFEEVPLAVHDIMLNAKLDIKKAIYPATINGDLVGNMSVIPANQQLIDATELIFLKSHREKLLHRQLEKIKDDFDFVLIDCSPTLNVVSKNAMWTADLFMVPTDMGTDSLDGIGYLLDVISEVKEGEATDFCIVRNMFQTTAKVTTSFIDSQLEEVKDVLFNATIRRLEKINQARMNREPIQLYDPNGEANTDYQNLITEFVQRYGH